MLRMLIDPSLFSIYSFQKGENPYIHTLTTHKEKAKSQHDMVKKSFKNIVVFQIETQKDKKHLSDMVFVANGGLSLPRLPFRVILLPNMKYDHRKKELPYLREAFRQMKIQTLPFPGSEPFEGQAELKWFHKGTKAVCGYGYRATLQAYKELNVMFQTLYKQFNLEPPTLLVLPLESDKFYHLDFAMMEYEDSKCIVHARAFSPKSLSKLRDFLGKENVHTIDTEDCFCLNSVIDGNNLLTHKLTDPKIAPILETLTKKHIVQIDTSEFELSGGSIRCMTLDIFN